MAILKAYELATVSLCTGTLYMNALKAKIAKCNLSEECFKSRYVWTFVFDQLLLTKASNFIGRERI